MKKLLLSVLVATAFGAQAGETTVDAFMFHEVMPEGDAVKARYYFNDRYMRVDEGSDTADFALFDREEGAFYSVVHIGFATVLIWGLSAIHLESAIRLSPKELEQKIKGSR
jgi:hypothetical protein